MDTTTCPECGALAEVEWRAVMESTAGPIEHARVRCVRLHWFLLPVSTLAAVTVAGQGTEPRRQVPAGLTRYHP